MRTPLDRLYDDGAERLTAGAIDAFVAGPGPRLLIVTGDVKQRPEAQDVAVVASELRRSLPALSVGVVGQEAEAEVRPRFKVEAVPSVIFFKDGRPVSTVTRVQDWQVYARTAQVVFGLKEAAR